MPVVPVVPGRRVATAPLPGARFSPDAPRSAFGVPAVPDLSGVARVVVGIAAERRQQADQVAVLDADNQLGALSDRLLYDRGTGVLTARGKTVLDVSAKVPDAWQKGVAEIEAGLSNDQQRLAFRRLVVARQRALHETVERHVSGELERYDDDTTKAALDLAANDALTNYADPQRVADAIAKARAITTDYATRRGMSDDQLAEQLAQQTSAIHVGVINRLLAAGQDRPASAYYAAHRGEVAGADAARVEAALEEGTLTGESQRQADTILGETTTLADALARVRTIDDPKLRDATQQRVEHDYTVRDAAQREQHQQLMLGATNIVERTRSYVQIPPATRAQLTLGERAALRSYAAQLAAGTPPATDWQVYYDLKQQAAADATRGQFIETDLLQYRGRLADQEFKELVTLQANLRKGDAGARAQADGYRTITQIVNDGLTAAGIDPTPKPNTDNATRVARFRRAVDAQLRAIQETSGKPATREDAQRVVDELLVEGTVAGSGIGGHFQTTRRAFERQPGETLVFDVQDVPAAERALIEAALTRAGLPITPARVLEMYVRRLNAIAPVEEPPLFRGTGAGATF